MVVLYITYLGTDLNHIPIHTDDSTDANARMIDRLPVEIILLIGRFLSRCELKHVSHVNKSMRIIHVPAIFQSVRVEFSHKSLQRLQALAASELCHHVSSLTYVVPELLKKGVSAHN